MKERTLYHGTAEPLRKSNYDITKEKMQAEFLKYDQEKMIRKFGLKSDADYLYITFVWRTCRINRTTGKVEEDQLTEKSQQTQGKQTGQEMQFSEAGFEAAMSIYDVLCDSKDGCHPSGQYVTLAQLPGTVVGAKPGNQMFQKTADYFDHNLEKLAAACECLHGTRERIGDVSYSIPIFDFLSVQLQFWASDDEFPASLQLLWDQNILDYMHYETTFYVAGYLFDQLRGTMEL
jgi:hypothetical protein